MPTFQPLPHSLAAIDQTMAAAGYTQSADGLQALKAQIKRPGLTVPELKNILRDHNLPVSGIKSELQIRLISCAFTHLPASPCTNLYQTSRNYTIPETHAELTGSRAPYLTFLDHTIANTLLLTHLVRQPHLSPFIRHTSSSPAMHHTAWHPLGIPSIPAA